MTTPAISLPDSADLAARIDSVKELLLFFRVGRRPHANAVDALISEAFRRLNTPTLSPIDEVRN